MPYHHTLWGIHPSETSEVHIPDWLIVWSVWWTTTDYAHSKPHLPGWPCGTMGLKAISLKLHRLMQTSEWLKLWPQLALTHETSAWLIDLILPHHPQLNTDTNICITRIVGLRQHPQLAKTQISASVHDSNCGTTVNKATNISILSKY